MMLKESGYQLFFVILEGCAVILEMIEIDLKG